MARRQLLALCAVLLVAQGAMAAAPKPADSKPPQKPSEHLKPEAAPQQQLGLLLPTGGQPGMAMMALPAAAATDPRSVKPVAGLPAGLPALAPAQPAAVPGAFPGALPGMAAPGGFPAAAPGYPAAAAVAGGYPAAAVGGFPAAANPAGYPAIAPGFPAAATTGPLMPAPLQAMPAPMLPTSLPGDGVMGLGGPPVIPGVTPTAGSSSKDMIGSSSYDSVFGSSVGSMSSGSMAGLSSSDPFSATAAMGGSGTLGGSGAGALGMGANGDASQALRNRRAAMNAAGSSQLAKGVAGLALLAAALLL